MAAIKIQDFGGLLPALSVRALPLSNALVANNLVARVVEFRPMLDSETYIGVLEDSDPATIHRFARLESGALNTDLSVNWRSYTDHMNLVSSQINDDETNRTSVTWADGSQAPRQIDNTGEDRLLGVPPPDQPVLTLNEGDYFTPEEREEAIEAGKAAIIAALKAECTPAKIGSPYTGDLVQGYMEDGAETGSPLSLLRYRVHRYDAEEGTITDAYTSAAEADVAWVRATRLGKWLQADGTPAWMGAAGTWHYALGYHAYGAGFEFDRAGAETALGAITTEGGGDLLTSDQIDELCDRVEELMDPDGPLANPVVQPLRDAVTAFEALIDRRPQGTQSSGEVATAITNAKTALANAIYDELKRNAGTYSVGGGGT